MSGNSLDQGIRANEAVLPSKQHIPAEAKSSDAMLFREYLCGGPQLPGCEIDDPNPSTETPAVKTPADAVTATEDRVSNFIESGQPEFASSVSGENRYNAFMFSDTIRYNFELVNERVYGPLPQANGFADLVSSAAHFVAGTVANSNNVGLANPKTPELLANNDTVVGNNDAGVNAQQTGDGTVTQTNTNAGGDDQIILEIPTAPELELELISDPGDPPVINITNPVEGSTDAPTLPVDNTNSNPAPTVMPSPSDTMTPEEIAQSQNTIDTEGDTTIFTTTYPNGTVHTSHFENGETTFNEWVDGPTGEVIDLLELADIIEAEELQQEQELLEQELQNLNNGSGGTPPVQVPGTTTTETQTTTTQTKVEDNTERPDRQGGSGASPASRQSCQP